MLLLACAGNPKVYTCSPVPEPVFNIGPKPVFVPEEIQTNQDILEFLNEWDEYTKLLESRLTLAKEHQKKCR